MKILETEYVTGVSLDGAVARDVFGMEVVPSPSIGSWQIKIANGEYRRLLSYSTDDATALRVLERMGELGWWAQITTPYRPGGSWLVGFTPQGAYNWDDSPDYEAAGRSLAGPTCAAALAAVRARAEFGARAHDEDGSRERDE